MIVVALVLIGLIAVLALAVAAAAFCLAVAHTSPAAPNVQASGSKTTDPNTQTTEERTSYKVTYKGAGMPPGGFDDIFKSFDQFFRPTVTCAVCGQKNRLGLRRNGIRCGRCKQPLIEARQ